MHERVQLRQDPQTEFARGRECGTISAVGLQYFTSVSDDCEMNESRDQIVMLFLSDLSRQEGNMYTTSQQEFDVPESRTGHGRYGSQTTNTRWKQALDVSDTISHCFPECESAVRRSMQ